LSKLGPVRSRKLFAAYIGRHRRPLVLGLLATGAGALASTIPPLFVGGAIDELGGAQDYGVVLGLAALMVAVTAVQMLLGAVGRVLVIGYGRDVEYDMRNDLFDHLQRMHLGYYQRQRIGDLMARLTNDLNAVRMMVGAGFMHLAKIAMTFVFTVAAMLSISVNLTLLSLVMLPLASLAFVVVGRRVNYLFRRVQAQFGELSAATQENLSGIRVVKAFGQEEPEIEAFAILNQGYLRRAIALARIENLIGPMMEGVLGLAVLAAIFLGGQEAIRGRMTVGQIVQFIAYLRLLAWPMQGSGWVATLFQTGWASLGRLREIFVAVPAIVDPAEPVVAPVRGELELRGVTMRYGSATVLDNVSLHVAPGRSLAIVGPTGAGKSTLVSLIPRLIDPNDGQVLVDGVDVRAWSLESLRRGIAIAAQDPFLFSASLREEIALGRGEPLDDAEIARVGEISQLSADVTDFPDGYDTVIGERGVTLSGGQKQRVALARAIARDPRILVLDDALSAVDTGTEAAILGHLGALPHGLRRITVAHRISTVKDSDEIIVLDGGRIVERGDHGQLLALDGWYARTYRRQLLEAELETPDLLAGDEADGVDQGGDGVQAGPDQGTATAQAGPGQLASGAES